MIEFRAYPDLALRLGVRPGPDEVPDGDVLCPDCNGDGRVDDGDGEVCKRCQGWAT